MSELSDLEKDRNSFRVPLVQERSREFSELHFLDVLIYLHMQVCRFYNFKVGKILYSVNHVQIIQNVLFHCIIIIKVRGNLLVNPTNVPLSTFPFGIKVRICYLRLWLCGMYFVNAYHCVFQPNNYKKRPL